MSLSDNYSENMDFYAKKKQLVMEMAVNKLDMEILKEQEREYKKKQKELEKELKKEIKQMKKEEDKKQEESKLKPIYPIQLSYKRLFMVINKMKYKDVLNLDNLAKFIYDNLILDSNKIPGLVCSDKSRCVFYYRDEQLNRIKDDKAIEFTSKIYKFFRLQIRRLYYANKPINPNLDDYNIMETSVYDEYKDIIKSNNRKIKELKKCNRMKIDELKTCKDDDIIWNIKVEIGNNEYKISELINEIESFNKSLNEYDNSKPSYEQYEQVERKYEFDIEIWRNRFDNMIFYKRRNEINMDWVKALVNVCYVNSANIKSDNTMKYSIDNIFNINKEENENAYKDIMDYEEGKLDLNKCYKPKRSEEQEYFIKCLFGEI